IVIPVIAPGGEVTEVYGRKITHGLRPGTPLHLYLPGPHRGVWNAAALGTTSEVILCEALIDALTFWCAGYRNVTAAYGVEGFTEAHWSLLEETETKAVRIAYDRDEAGNRAAEALSEKLNAKGIETYRVLFPKGMDANAYAKSVTPASQSLGLVLRNAEWMGKGAPPEGRAKATTSALLLGATMPSTMPTTMEEMKAEAPSCGLIEDHQIEIHEASDALIE